MSNREYAAVMLNEAIVNEIPEEKLGEVIEDIIDTLSEYLDRGTIMELERMAYRANPHPKTYKNFKEFLEQLEDDDDEDNV